MNGPRASLAPATHPRPGGSDRAGRAALGAFSLFVPAALLLAFALWQRHHGLGERLVFDEPDEPDRTALSGSVQGWSGRLDRPGAPPLVLRLETLHPFASRQGFDAAALARRFRGGDPAALGAAAEKARGGGSAVGGSAVGGSAGGGSAGGGSAGGGSAGGGPGGAAALDGGTRTPAEGPQPWRLSVSVAPRGGGDVGGDADGEDGLRSSGPGSAGTVPFDSLVIADLSRLRVDGLEPLVLPADGRGAATVTDPLESLLRFTESDLREGEACDLVFWGAPPSGVLTVHVPGLRGPDGAVGVAVVELRPTSRAASRASEAIARLDARSVEASR